MQYSSLVYNLLPNLFWSITPALPGGAGSGGTVGTRRPVGFPEVIPDITFIAREIKPTDGFSSAERIRLNEFIRGAKSYHTLFGLAPDPIESLDDLLTRFRPPRTAPIGRIRLVAHGNENFVFLPLFTGAPWNFGMQPDRLQAFQSSDEEGLRFLITNHATQSPTMANVVNKITTGIRTVRSAVLAPFGLAGGGGPQGELLKYFEVVNDLYQVQYGTVVIASTLLTLAQQNTLTTSLTLIENAVRKRLIGTQIGAVQISGDHLNALRDEVLRATPVQLGFLGPPVNLSATVIADVQAARAAALPVIANPHATAAALGTAEAALRVAISGAEMQPLLLLDYLNSLVAGVEIFRPAQLKLGGLKRNLAFLRANADLQAFALVSGDLHHLRTGAILIDGQPVDDEAEKNPVRLGLVAIADIISKRIRSKPGNKITIGELNGLRTEMEGRPMRETTLTGRDRFDSASFAELAPANAALQGGFRVRLDHFRGLMKPGNASAVDVRGCLVGQAPAFLVTLGDFLGTAATTPSTTANKPTITAPVWLQSFPSGRFLYETGSGVTAAIDALVKVGRLSISVKNTDVDTCMTTWSGLIDFDKHFEFIVALFAADASIRDLATLDWRVWKSAENPAGIPILRMEAPRVDDLTTLTKLGDIIERFRVIFDIDPGKAPSEEVRENLTKLQPHVTTFKRKSVALASATTPSAQFIADLSTLATGIVGIGGFPAPITALTPPPTGATLQQIRDFAKAIGDHLDRILKEALDAFFAAVQKATDNPNAPIRYFYNIGLPLLLQSSTKPTSWVVSMFVSGSSTDELLAAALRSWMRIQWTGSGAQATDMNDAIRKLKITNDGERGKAGTGAMLSEDEHNPQGDAGVNPMQTFHDNIATRPV